MNSCSFVNFIIRLTSRNVNTVFEFFIKILRRTWQNKGGKTSGGYFSVKKTEQSELCSDVVEVRRIELLSENISLRVSPSAGYAQNSLRYYFITKVISSVVPKVMAEVGTPSAHVHH